MTSNQTSPVNVSAGPLTLACLPWMSTLRVLFCDSDDAHGDHVVGPPPQGSLHLVRKLETHDKAEESGNRFVYTNDGSCIRNLQQAAHGVCHAVLTESRSRWCARYPAEPPCFGVSDSTLRL